MSVIFADRNTTGSSSTDDTPPLWTSEGPQFYDAAFAYHKPWSKPGPYQTPIPGDETAFRDWITTYSVPFDPDASTIDYDMRGYWVARIKDTSIGYTTGEHFPDIWKTPYDTTFSSESIYARDGCPYNWHGDKLINDADGTLIFWASYKPTAQTATSYLGQSKINPAAQTKGLMGDDLDLQALGFYVSEVLKLKGVEDQLEDATIVRTIRGASTITLVLNDDDRMILRSGLLSNKLDIQIDGMWFRLVQVGKDEGDNLTLTFETREISYLRMYTGKKIVAAGSMTRAEFILSLIRELPFTVPVVIPELHIQQVGTKTAPVDTPLPGTNNDGIPTDLSPTTNPIGILGDPRRGLTIKGQAPNPQQISNVNTILGDAVQMGANRKVMVCAIMTAIDESSIENLSGGLDDSAGVFQQRPSQGWGTYDEVTNVDHAARKFLSACISEDRKNPTLPYTLLCHAVQGNKDENVYAQYQPEAENWVTAYLLSPGSATPLVPDTVTGIVSGAVSTITSLTGGLSGTPTPTKGSDGYFYRGVPGQDNADWGLEDSWTCIQRLADEVNWRAFFVGGTFWYLDDETLFKIKPIMNLTESSIGVDTVSFDYDNNKKSGTVNLSARVGRWLAQPGAVVQLQNMGPVNGKWLVQEFDRSLFDLTASISLTKPLPKLPKPDTGDPLTDGSTTTPTLPPSSSSVVIPPQGVVPTGPCISIAGDVKTAMDLGQFKVWHPEDMTDVRQAALGQPCTDGVPIDCNVWKVIMYLLNNGWGPISSYAIHSAHGPDGLGGHSTGFAFDLNMTKGHDFGSNDPNGTNIMNTALFLRAAPPEVRPHGMIITGWQQQFHDEAAKLCIPDGSYYGTGPTGFNWDVSPTSHANHIHICYTPGIPS